VVGYPLVVAERLSRLPRCKWATPSCCIFVDNFDELDWRGIGPQIENHKQFPDRTNVVFVKVLDRKTIELRIWERGVGETSASGSCSCAAAVASMVNNKTDRLLTAETPGGKVKIQWRDDNEVVITGSAEVIYSGDWLAPFNRRIS
jgi:diaminopimelate epimerase